MHGNQFNVSFVQRRSMAHARVTLILIVNTRLCQKINTIFTCGYIVGMIPSAHCQSYSGMMAGLTTCVDNLMLQVVPPRLWFPFMQILWGVLTFW